MQKSHWVFFLFCRQLEFRIFWHLIFAKSHEARLSYLNCFPPCFFGFNALNLRSYMVAVLLKCCGPFEVKKGEMININTMFKKQKQEKICDIFRISNFIVSVP